MGSEINVLKKLKNEIFFYFEKEYELDVLGRIIINEYKITKEDTKYLVEKFEYMEKDENIFSDDKVFETLEQAIKYCSSTKCFEG